MGSKTGIEWTDATWNPVTGCTRVSTGCDHCYAAVLAERRLREIYLRRAPVVDSEEARTDPFAVRLWPERLELPLSWSHPQMVFVNSMSDLFHHDVPDDFVLRVFEVMLSADWHVYQVLTKRPARAAKFWERYRSEFALQSIPQHIWMGTSVEDQSVAYRVRHLGLVNAETRFLSCEPLIGPLTLDLTRINWVIVGGESGTGFRPLNLEWAVSIRDQCEVSKVPFFFKQIGGRTPKAGGRLLEGREWSEYPEALDAARNAVVTQ